MQLKNMHLNFLGRVDKKYFGFLACCKSGFLFLPFALVSFHILRYVYSYFIYTFMYVQLFVVCTYTLSHMCECRY